MTALDPLVNSVSYSGELKRNEDCNMSESDAVVTGKAILLDAAYKLANDTGFDSLTRDNVARAAGMSSGMVNHRFVTMDGLRDEVMRTAIERTNLAIIGHGLAIRHPIALSAPEDIKRQALDALL